MKTVEKRKQFGTRYLLDESETFNYNAWDNVEWDDVQKLEAEAKIAEQKNFMLDKTKAQELLSNCNEKWEKFYQRHEGKFFMNRNWLLTEFPELDTNTMLASQEPLQILEVGCGVGNTVFPLVSSAKVGRFFIHCCDYSSKAVEIVKQNPAYNEQCCHAFVWDIADTATSEIGDESLDVILCIYVLSAVPPAKHKQALSNLCRLLKPGGILLLKDYGQYDMTQLRFKKGRLIDNKLYCRGDGTLVYYFTQDELDELFSSSGLIKVTNVLDRRLIVNRAKRTKMYRIWIQCKYQKLK